MHTFINPGKTSVPSYIFTTCPLSQNVRAIFRGAGSHISANQCRAHSLCFCSFLVPDHREPTVHTALNLYCAGFRLITSRKIKSSERKLKRSISLAKAHQTAIKTYTHECKILSVDKPCFGCPSLTLNKTKKQVFKKVGYHPTDSSRKVWAGSEPLGQEPITQRSILSSHLVSPCRRRNRCRPPQKHSPTLRRRIAPDHLSAPECRL